MDSVLSSYRVLDLTDEKGIFCAKLLADMGAEVIRLDKPGTDVAKDLFFREINVSTFDITLNIETEPGRRILKRLIKTSDVIVESYPPGYLEALGLGYPELSGINRQLVMASITGFGQNGPYRDYKVSDMVASALGGQMYVCGEAETPPLKPFGTQAYHAACLLAANGVLLALYNRHATARGQHIDISVMDAVAATLDHVLVRYFYDGVVAERQGSLHWDNSFRVFPCRDGSILLSLFQHWETLVEWLEDEGLAEDLADERWLDSEDRLQHLDHIVDVLERWTQSHTVAELVEKGQLMHFPWAGVTIIPGLMSSPQLIERSLFVEVEHPESGKRYKHPGVPCQLSRSPWRVGSRVPGIGEHNTEIYHRELGLSTAEIGTLAKDGVI